MDHRETASLGCLSVTGVLISYILAIIIACASANMIGPVSWIDWKANYRLEILLSYSSHLYLAPGNATVQWHCREPDTGGRCQCHSTVAFTIFGGIDNFGVLYDV